MRAEGKKGKIILWGNVRLYGIINYTLTPSTPLSTLLLHTFSLSLPVPLLE